jgi:hypothetical protein
MPFVDRYIDIATTNPTHYLQLRHAFELTGVIATTMRKGDKDSVAVLSGVIFSKNNRHDINRDLCMSKLYRCRDDFFIKI